ncbi:MAG: Bro-N domain-containing protein [Bacilli bacterium]
MKNEIEIFKNKELGEVRTLTINSEPYFVAKDVAKILGYSETNALTKRLDNDEFISDKLEGMNMKSILLNESGLYNAIFGSKLESAKKFRKWVFHEVLPSIRKHGAYITEELLADNEKLQDTISQLQLDSKMIKEEKEELQNEVYKLRTERHMPSVVCLKAKTDESYLPDLALQLTRLYIKDHDDIITRKTKDGIYIKRMPIERELKKITFTSKERYYLVLCIGSVDDTNNEIFIKNDFLEDDFFLKSVNF